MKSFFTRFVVLTLLLTPLGLATAQGPAPAFDTLKADWVRPDGGYRISIAAVGADGRIEATYFNPEPSAVRQGAGDARRRDAPGVLRTAGGRLRGFDLRARLCPASDRLKGVYYQAVAKQKSDVYFMRK